MEISKIGESKGKKIAYAIEKECCRDSLIEWCEEREFTIEDFNRFLAAGIEGLDSQAESGADNEHGGPADHSEDAAERIDQAIALIKKYGVLDKRSDKYKMYELMKFETLDELALSFSSFNNLIYDLRDILEGRTK